MEMQLIVWTLAGGVLIGMFVLRRAKRRVFAEHDLSPVSKQWLSEQKGRAE